MNSDSLGSSALRAVGKTSQVDVIVGGKESPKDSPLIVGSMRGGFEWWTDQVSVDINDVFSWVNHRDDGAWIGLLPNVANVSRPVGFIQSNRSSFYRAHHRSDWFGSGKIWKDFYFASFYRLILEVDSAFRATDIQIQHPTLSSNQWSKEMQGIFLDALNQLVDHEPLQLERIHLGCPHDMTRESLHHAAALINREQATDPPPELEPVTFEEVEPASVGCPDHEGLRLIRLEIRRPTA